MIFKKERLPNGRRHIYLFGIKICSYKKRLSQFDKIYAQRFCGLPESKIRYCLEQQFKNALGYPLNLDNPNTFNEKLQWLKLYYRNPLMTRCADKVAVRDYVAEKIGTKYLIPCLGIWDNPDDIDFEKLPDKFVLKVNWGSGQNIIVKDKSKLDVISIRRQLSQWMQPDNNLYFRFFEWGYKNIKPKIIAEKYIEQMDGKLLDYKFFCFNGVPKYCQIDIDRYVNHTRCFYNMEYDKQEFTVGYPIYQGNIEKPDRFAEMSEIARILSENFPHVRVDLFAINNNIYFGEMTFFHGAGYERFQPFEWDKSFGDLLILPDQKIK